MMTRSGITAIAALALTLTATSSLGQGRPQNQDRPRDRAQTERGQHDVDRDRMENRDRMETAAQDRDRDRDQDRTHAPDFAKLRDHDIYGSEIMSAQERNAYRKRLQDASTTSERKRIEAQHRNTVETRAQTQGVKLSPPGQGIYGGAMLSVEERNQFREELRMIDSDEAKVSFMAQHREEMQMRAKAQGIDIERLEETEEAE